MVFSQHEEQGSYDDHALLRHSCDNAVAREHALATLVQNAPGSACGPPCRWFRRRHILLLLRGAPQRRSLARVCGG